jgi:hypothetical protein
MIAKTRNKQDARDERQAAPPAPGAQSRAGRFAASDSLYPLVQPISRPLLLLAQAESASLRRRHGVALFRQGVINAVERLRARLGISERVACRILGISNVSYSRWRKAKAAQGFGGLVPAVSPGRPARTPKPTREPERLGFSLVLRQQGKKFVIELKLSSPRHANDAR